VFNTVAERVIPRVIIELDFDADPDTAPEVIQADIADQIPAFKQPVAIDGDRMIFEDPADALAAYLRYGANVVRVITEAE
jgi:hypothetical protein